MALENLHLMFLYVTFCITLGHLHQASLQAIVQVQIYLWQLSYLTQCIYVASDLEMLLFCVTFVECEMNRGKKIARQRRWSSRTHTPRLRNRRGLMVAQRCLGPKTNSPERLRWWTAETNSKPTSFWPDLVWNDVISVRSSISFEESQIAWN